MVKTPNRSISLSLFLWDHQQPFSLDDAVHGVPATEEESSLVIWSDLGVLVNLAHPLSDPRGFFFIIALVQLVPCCQRQFALGNSMSGKGLCWLPSGFLFGNRYAFDRVSEGKRFTLHTPDHRGGFLMRSSYKLGRVAEGEAS
ncbi:hypothetical protein PGT21_020752 [Puccinia graminis f. sp. tritici]|uniref:Uncharacterized protein n=1 Tax=Puccinia graminis f. sp. tritici TaxID=56615 RepID=A0A5B0LZ58_PUCGR|nr:hypothetical protein PGT21_020752 [Puccinia graminis f. sp. tritici]